MSSFPEKIKWSQSWGSEAGPEALPTQEGRPALGPRLMNQQVHGRWSPGDSFSAAKKNVNSSPGQTGRLCLNGILSRSCAGY